MNVWPRCNSRPYCGQTLPCLLPFSPTSALDLSINAIFALDRQRFCSALRRQLFFSLFEDPRFRSFSLLFLSSSLSSLSSTLHLRCLLSRSSSLLLSARFSPPPATFLARSRHREPRRRPLLSHRFPCTFSLLSRPFLLPERWQPSRLPPPPTSRPSPSPRPLGSPLSRRPTTATRRSPTQTSRCPLVLALGPSTRNIPLLPRPLTQSARTPTSSLTCSRASMSLLSPLCALLLFSPLLVCPPPLPPPPSLSQPRP